MMNDDQRRQEAIIAQQDCRHDPQPVTGMASIKRCSKCKQYFGRHQFEMIEARRKLEKI
jgi:hypothetical protein